MFNSVLFHRSAVSLLHQSQGRAVVSPGLSADSDRAALVNRPPQFSRTLRGKAQQCVETALEFFHLIQQ